ncbi:MAG: non-hydrolyzing UDP-N-acetylglucosamine 2-epimerase [Gemmataceae bacterium]
MKILLVAGARPNFVKVAPLLWNLKQRPQMDYFLVHTGQHYDYQMSTSFFEELEIPAPDAYLDVGSGSHAVQTAEVMKRFEPIVAEECPDVVVVVGDVNSTLACALTAVKMHVPVAHVEAGLRSFDRSMPEEINRLVTDSISQWLFVSEPSGMRNLRAEGAASERVFHVGNVMIDTLYACREKIDRQDVHQRLGLRGQPYGVLTLHRPANVDDPEHFEVLAELLEQMQRELPLVFPVHPRTRKMLAALPEQSLSHVIQTEPMGYLSFLKLVSGARVVVTDSGGLQEETTALGVPCLTLRDNTERPITIEQGTNTLVGTDPEVVLHHFRRVLRGDVRPYRVPDLWDGHAAERVLDVLAAWRAGGVSSPVMACSS